MMRSMMLACICLLCFSALPLEVNAQYPCKGSLRQEYLNANYIHAGFLPRGNKFTTGETGSFIVPYPMSQYLSTIFASSPWIGGFDDAGNLKQAYELYPRDNSGDFSVGPLNYIGLGYDSVCHQFDRAWIVFAEDIMQHRLDFDTDGKIDDTLSVIFGWPASGNEFFSRYNGFDFPDPMTFGRADFMDLNTNGRYEPDKGDYPVVMFQGRPVIPDQMLWMIFNDVDGQDTVGPAPMRFEIQLTAFALFCQDNPVLNHTVFNVYKLTNRGVTPLDSTFFGMWTDYDLGCSNDDLIGCDSTRSAEFVYNYDDTDGDVGEFCTSGSAVYPGIPPVQSMTYLSHPMHSFIAPQNLGSHVLAAYRVLTGTWPDGVPMVAEGEGYMPGSTAPGTRYLFHGDPRDSTSWSAIHARKEGMDYRTVSSVSLDRFNPGEQKSVEMAYTYHHLPDAGHLDQLTKMYNDIDSLHTWAPYLQWHCAALPFCYGDACVWPGDFNHDGIVNHFDMLEWGVMKDAAGPAREGRIHWRGYGVQDWSETTPLDINYKHGDGNGDGLVDTDDLTVNVLNHMKRKEGVVAVPEYTPGDELVIRSDPMDESGRIRHIRVETDQELPQVYGLTFELDYDTLLYKPTVLPKILGFPADTGIATYIDGQYGDGSGKFSQGNTYGFVGTEHKAWDIPQGFLLMGYTTGISLQSQVSIDDLPDTVVIRLRNIRAIDVEGNRISLGSQSLKVPKFSITSVNSTPDPEIRLYPVPSTGQVRMETIRPDRARLYSLSGMPLRTFDVEAGGHTLDLSEMPPGMYLLQMASNGDVLKVVLTGMK